MTQRPELTGRRAGALLIGLATSAAVWGGLWALIPELQWRSFSPGWLTLGVGASLVIWFARACRLWALKACSLSLALKVVAVHGGLLRVTPMRLGELSLPYLLKRWGEVPVTHSAALLLWVRLSELMALALTTCCALLSLAWRSELLNGVDIPPLALSCACGLILALLGASLRYARSAIERASASLLRAGEQRGWGELTRLMRRLEDGRQELPKLSISSALLLCGLSVSIFITQLALFECVLLSCGWSELGWEGLVIGSAATHLSGVAPLPTIGNVGGHELGWVMGFRWVGVPHEVTLISALLSQLYTLALALLWWLLSYFLPLPLKECEGRSVESLDNGD